MTNSRKFVCVICILVILVIPSSIGLASAQASVSITITSNPTGPNFVLVDGNVTTTPATFSWTAGSNHTLQAVAVVYGPNSNDTRYLFNGRWSDGGIQTHTYTVPSSSETVVANYTTQYFVLFYVNPPGAGVIEHGGTLGPVIPSGTGIWEPAGYSIGMPTMNGSNSSTIYIGVMVSPGFVFSSFNVTGLVSIATPDLFDTTATINGPGAITANFRNNPGNSIPVSSPSIDIYTIDGGPAPTTRPDFVIVDGKPTPFGSPGGDWSAGTNHTLVARSVVTFSDMPGIQFVFVGWSDGGFQNHTYTVKGEGLAPAFSPPGDQICALYKTQYLITFNQMGLDSGTTGTVLKIDGQSKAYSDLPFSEWVDSYTIVDYSYSPTVSSNSGKQFSLKNVSDIPVKLTPYLSTGPNGLDSPHLVGGLQIYFPSPFTGKYETVVVIIPEFPSTEVLAVSVMLVSAFAVAVSGRHKLSKKTRLSYKHDADTTH